MGFAKVIINDNYDLWNMKKKYQIAICKLEIILLYKNVKGKCYAFVGSLDVWITLPDIAQKWLKMVNEFMLPYSL